MRISDWSSDVCSSDLPTLKTRYGLVRTLAYGGTAESFAEARRELEATDRLAGDRLRDENEVALYAAIARGQFHFQQLQVEPALEAHLRAEPLQRRLRPAGPNMAALVRGAIADGMLRLDIGRASGGESVWQYVSYAVGAGALK